MGSPTAGVVVEARLQPATASVQQSVQADSRSVRAVHPIMVPDGAVSGLATVARTRGGTGIATRAVRPLRRLRLRPPRHAGPLPGMRYDSAYRKGMKPHLSPACRTRLSQGIQS